MTKSEGVMKALKPILFLILMMLTSCGGGKKGTTETSIALGFGTIGDSTLVDGGVMIYGWADDGTERFGFRYANQAVDLKNGGWQFVALAWDDDALSGTLRCAQAAVFLNGQNTTIPLNLSTANCTQSIFGSGDTKEINGQPFELIFKTCANDSCMYDYEDSYRPPLRGVAQSFEIALAGLDNAGNPSIPNSMIGPCVTHTGDDPEVTSSTAKLPMVNLPVATIIRAYDDSSCSGTFEEYIFPNGIRQSLGDRSVFFSDPLNSQNIITLKSELCKETAPMSGTVFRFSTTDTHIICTPQQFIAIQGNTTDTTYVDTYVLGNDLDFTGESSYVPIGTSGTPFKGEFIGRDHTISNMDVDVSGTDNIGLFGAIEGVSDADPAVITNLKLSNVHITATTDNVTNVGVLVGNVGNSVGYARIAEIDADDIKVIAQNCSSSCNAIGGLLGTMTGSNFTEAYEVDMVDVHIGTTGSADNVGGIAGHNVSNSGLRYSSIDLVTFIHTSNGTSNYFGGAVGTLEGEIWDVVVSNLNMNDDDALVDFDVNSDIGGLVGRAMNSARVNYAKAHGNITPANSVTNVGGLFGNINGGNNYRDLVSNVTLDILGDKVGGIAGVVVSSTPSIEIQRARNFGAILDCGTDCGGIVGNMDSGSSGEVKLNQVHNYGVITATGPNHTGGIVGYYTGTGTGNNGSITYASNHVDITGDNHVGGIIGKRDYGTANRGSLFYAYNLGNITSGTGSGQQAGGLIGDVGTLDSGVISETYSTGTVTAPNSDDALEGYIAGGTPPSANSLCHLPNGKSQADGLCNVLTAAGDENDVTKFTLFSGEWDDHPDGNKPPILFNWAPVMLLGDDTVGSENDPFLISTREQWNAIGDNPELMDKAYKLVADISFNDTQGDFKPIGSTSHPFYGKFNGNGFTLSNIYLDDSANSDNEPLGIFRVIGNYDYGGSNWSNGASIGNWDYDSDNPGVLYITDFEFIGRDHADSYLGGLVGLIDQNGSSHYMGVRISDVELSNGILTAGTSTPAVGGAIGALEYETSGTEIIDITNYSTIDSCGNNNAGGIIGKITETATVTSDPLMIDTLINYGDVDCSSTDYVGGIVGYSQDQDSPGLEFAQNYGNITGNDNVGGIAGANYSEIVIGFNKGIITGNDNVGGIVGDLNDGMVVGTYVEADVTASGTTATAGGITGNCGSSCQIGNSYFAGVVSSTGTGGIGDHIRLPLATGRLTNNYYLSANDLSIPGSTNINTFDDMRQPQNMPNIGTGIPGGENPWIHFPGDLPRFHFELFPELFNH